VPLEEYNKALEENKKLKYRITHLCRALDQLDGGASGQAAQSSSLTLYTDESEVSNNVSICQVVAGLTGVALNVSVVDQETQ